MQGITTSLTGSGVLPPDHSRPADVHHQRVGSKEDRHGQQHQPIDLGPLVGVCKAAMRDVQCTVTYISSVQQNSMVDGTTHATIAMEMDAKVTDMFIHDRKVRSLAK